MNPYPGYDPKKHLNDSQRQQVNLIVLHHTVTPENYTWKQISDIGKTRTYAGYDHSYHYDPQTGEETFIAYHYLVYKDGSYRQCLPDFAVGWHCGNWEKNCRSIAISSVGDFSNQDPTDAQIQTIANIARPYDRAVGGQLSILGHKEISATACPGRILNFRDRIVTLINQDPTPPTPEDPCAAITRQFHETNALLVSTQAQVEALQKENAQLKAQIEGMENERDQLNGRINGLNTMIEKLNRELSDDLDQIKGLREELVESEKLRSDQMAVAEGQIREKDTHIREIESSLNDANIKLKSQSDLIARLQSETLQAVDNKTLFSEFMRRIWKIRRG